MAFKKFLVVLTAFLFVACATAPNMSLPNTSPVASATDMAITGKAATVAFTTQSMGKEAQTYPYCSGAWINPTTILTAFHCSQAAAFLEEIRQLPVEDRKLALAIMPEPTETVGTKMTYVVEADVVNLVKDPKATHNAIVIATDPDHDLALVKVQDASVPAHTWLHVADFLPTVGDKVYVIGHPGGLYFTFFDGMISAIRQTDTADFEDGSSFKGPFIQVFSGIYKGNSGGPIISASGELLGIVSFTQRSPNEGFAIASPSIKRFIIDSYRKNLL